MREALSSSSVEFTAQPFGNGPVGVQNEHDIRKDLTNVEMKDDVSSKPPIEGQ
jgi:hypothetical protein